MGSDAGRPVTHSAEEILSVVGDKRLTTREIAAELDCHPETANRRLRQLEEDGLLSSTRSGQMLLWTRARQPRAFLVRVDADRIPNFIVGIRTPIEIVRDGVPPSLVPDPLQEYEAVRAWTVSRSVALDYLSEFERMYPGDRLLFTWEDTIIADCALDRRVDNPQVSDYLWPETVGRESTEYPITLLLTDYRPRSIVVADLVGSENAIGDRHHQRTLTQLPEECHASLVAEYGSLESALAEIHTDPPALLPVEREPDTVERDDLPESVPTGVGKTERWTRAMLQHQLAARIKDAYENQCAVCDSHRLTPSNEPEIEVAYLQPLSEGGEPTSRNAIALCRLHHWALDVGWLAISDQYDVLVRDRPEQPGFNDFIQFAGTSLSLPADETVHPDPAFLRAHRERVATDEWLSQPLEPTG
ncbi:helix-turn-helix domain-containing protein [Natrialbaceae archaeon GCM10025896]